MQTVVYLSACDRLWLLSHPFQLPPTQIILRIMWQLVQDNFNVKVIFQKTGKNTTIYTLRCAFRILRARIRNISFLLSLYGQSSLSVRFVSCSQIKDSEKF